MTGGARRRRRSRRPLQLKLTPALEALRAEVKLSELSDEDFIVYIRHQYPPSVVRALMGIQQTAAAFHQQPATRAGVERLVERTAKVRARRRPRHVIQEAPGPRLHRYMSHAIVLAVAIAMSAGHSATPVLVVAGAGFVIVAVLLFAGDAFSSAFAFTIRNRAKGSSYELTVRVKASSWSRTNVGRVLSLAARLLPPEYREDFVEDQAANLVSSDSHLEQLSYFIDLILEIPRVAWQFYAERRRRPAK